MPFHVVKSRKGGASMETRKPHRKKEDYKLRTHMIHGNFDSKNWDYDHHVVPPVSHTTAYRLSSLGAGRAGLCAIRLGRRALERAHPDLHLRPAG